MLVANSVPLSNCPGGPSGRSRRHIRRITDGVAVGFGKPRSRSVRRSRMKATAVLVGCDAAASCRPHGMFSWLG